MEKRTPDNLEHSIFRVIFLFMLGFTVFNYAYNGLFRPLFTEKIDFEAYYNAALAFRYGAPIYQPMVDFFGAGPLHYEGPLPYVYPPGFVLLLSPLAYLDFKVASVCWLLFNHLLFFSGVLMLMKSISKTYSKVETGTMVFVSMNFTPLFVDYLIGQSNIILFFLITSALYLFRRGKSVYAGGMLALAFSIKIIPGLLLIYMLWKRQYKVFAGGLVVILLLFMYSLLFFKMGLFEWYFKFMLKQSLFDAFHDNHSLTGFFTRLMSHSIWVRGVFENPVALRICILLASVFILIGFFYLTRKRCHPSDDRTLREYGLGVATMLLLSKLTTTPYLVMMLLPLLILVKDMFEHRPSYTWCSVLAVAYGIIATWQPLPAGKFLDMDSFKLLMNGYPANLFSLQFFAILGIWSYFAFGSPHMKPSENHVDNGKMNQERRGR